MSIINTLMENFLIKMVLSLLIVHSLVNGDKNNEQRFQFPEFDYKETSKNVSIFNKWNRFSNLSKQTTQFPRNCLIENSNQHVSKVLTVRNYHLMEFKDVDASWNAFPRVAITIYTDLTRYDFEKIYFQIFLEYFLYSFQLEEGEIDVRLISFKGCFVQRSGRSRNR